MKASQPTHDPACAICSAELLARREAMIEKGEVPLTTPTHTGREHADAAHP